jgi:ADP-ribosylglycohydrolase
MGRRLLSAAVCGRSRRRPLASAILIDGGWVLTLMVFTSSQDKALLSLEGLSVGDSFGELCLRGLLDVPLEGALPPGPWEWTDDTMMALSIVEVLCQQGGIDQNRLASAFARRFLQDPYRGYGAGAFKLLTGIARGGDWRDLSPRLFGTGSYGNGAAMRAAPIGGYFHGDPERAAHEAQRSAEITHAHPEGQAGAIAVAAAAALADRSAPGARRALFQEVLRLVPQGATRDGIALAEDIPADQLTLAMQDLGTGQKISAQDTVPFCIWVAANHLEDYERALRTTVLGEGDSDTTCAIVGGIVALSVGNIPRELIESREPLPALDWGPPLEDFDATSDG